MPAANYNAAVLANGAAGENVMLLTARWDETTPAPACGQFYMLRAWKAEEAPLLSRPISVHRFDREKKEISFLYEVRGTGTQKLAALRPGDTVALTGPSGRGFPVDGTVGGAVALVGGGIGIPPMLELARQLDCEKQAVLGYRDVLFLNDEFEKFSDVYVVTEDGSAGTKGNVLDAIRENGLKADVIFACGPTPMLRALKAYAEEHEIECWLSLEEKMACGIGACLACVCQSKEVDEHSHVHNKRICKDGPVFLAQEVEL